MSAIIVKRSLAESGVIIDIQEFTLVLSHMSEIIVNREI